MKKINKPQVDPNDVPVIFLYDDNGMIADKVSINQWTQRIEENQHIENFEIRLYREALNYYGAKEFSKAEDLLKFLIKRTDYTHYEYIERLANIYRQQNRSSLEKELLLTTRKYFLPLEFSEGIVKRIDKRLEKLECLSSSAAFLTI